MKYESKGFHGQFQERENLDADFSEITNLTEMNFASLKLNYIILPKIYLKCLCFAFPHGFKTGKWTGV